MTDHHWTTTSRHPTSEGTVVYESCGCGMFRVRLDPAGAGTVIRTAGRAPFPSS